MNRISAWILKHPKISLLLLVLVTVLVGIQARKTEFESSIESFIVDNDPDNQFYNEYKKKFDQDQVLVVAFEDEQIFTAENLSIIRRLTERLEGLDYVFDVSSLTNAEYMASTEDSFEATPLVDKEELPKGPALTAAKKRAIENPVFRQDLISLNGRQTSLLVTLRSREEKYQFEKEIVEIEQILQEESARTHKRLYIAGERYMDMRFLRYIHEDLERLLPLTCAMLLIIFLVIFRNLRDTAIALVTISLSLMWVGGLLPLTGLKMNPVNAGMPSLILCITVVSVIQIIHHFRLKLKAVPDRERALSETVREMMMPIFLCTMTTVIGFGSCATNDVRPIRDFGILAALAISTTFIVLMIAVPAMLALWKEPRGNDPTERQLIPHAWLSWWAKFLVRRTWLVGGAMLALLLIAIAGIPQLKAQVDRARYLKESSDVYQSLRFVEDNLAGTNQLDISIESGQEGTFKEPWVLHKVEKLSAFLRAMPEIDKVISLNDFLKEMNKAFYAGKPECYTLPETRESTAQFLLIYSMSGRKDVLDKYVDYPYSRTRVSVRTSEHNSARLDELASKINTYLAQNFEAPLDAHLASAVVANNNVFRYLLKGMGLNLLTSVVLVGILMCLGFRSVYVGLLSMIPNVIPLVFVLGLMGWCDIWLEISTTMVFSIALGEAVDDTIHFIQHFREEVERHGDHHKAFIHTFESIGSAVVESGITITGGFLVLAFSALKMNIMFGLLCAFIMVVGLLSEFTITPFLLLTLKPFKQKIAKAIKQPKQALKRVVVRRVVPKATKV